MNHFKLFLFILIVFNLEIFGQDTILIPTQKMPKEFGCYRADKNGIIKSEEELKSIVHPDNLPARFRCDTFSLPKIDFEKNYLIWIHFGGGYRPKVETYLYKILSKKKYLFLIKVSDGGNQAVANFLVTHELTEKLEKGYSFEYKIEQNENYNEK